MIFINHNIATYMVSLLNHALLGVIVGILYDKEMRSKGQVATHEASIHYANLTLLSIAVSWNMLLDKCSLFVLV